MPNTHDLENSNPQSGDILRDEVSSLLSGKYGLAHKEWREKGKKVDLYFKYSDLGRDRRLYVECKDYSKRLSRSDLVNIAADYGGILKINSPCDLLIVTREGVSTDAEQFIHESDNLRHQTIWALEANILGLTSYVRSLTTSFDEDGLSSYYIPPRASRVRYVEGNQARYVLDDEIQLTSFIDSWIASDESGLNPFAILGGYGAGKSSFARRLAQGMAQIALKDPMARRPILVRMGQFSRYSSLEGLFGGMFSSDFHVSGFNFHEFMRANERGRFIIILDGFDEMKHAMSWSDFRGQLAEINRLIQPLSRVLLLGRPSAFISQEEHIHVLRGRKKNGEIWRRMPNWPEFKEIELLDFTDEERATFVQKYLAETTKRSLVKLSEQDIVVRISKINALADLAPDVFAKPVHAKILTDLAADPEFDLNRFQGRVTRWDLYEAFFVSLAERESEKQARRPVGDKTRLGFLREIATWLWAEKGGSVSFAAPDIPESLFLKFDVPDGVDFDGKSRELLTGSLLEKKSKDIFYFGHRSFAEFLVAQRMILNKPSANEHSLYSRLYKDGVQLFFDERAINLPFGEWVKTFSYNRGVVRFEYLLMLVNRVGGLRYFYKIIQQGVVWKDIFECFNQTIEFNPSIDAQFISKIRSGDNILSSFLILFLAFSLSQRHTDMRGIDGGNISRLIAHLLFRESNKIKDSYNMLGNRPELAKATFLTSGVFLRNIQSTKIEVDLNRLIDNALDILKSVGIGIEFDGQDNWEIFEEKIIVKTDDVTGSISLFSRPRIKSRLEQVKVRSKFD